MSDVTSAQHAPRRIAVAFHPRIPDAAPMASEVAAFARQAGARAEEGSLSEESFQAAIAGGGYDLVIALGGDGTVLRAAHACAQTGTPVLGINLGTLGFLAEFRRDGWRDGIAQILRGAYWLETRMMLRAEQWRGGARLGEWEALNECAVTRSARMILLHTSIDGHPFTAYAADGLIAATATGSTAYALAAGGPILPPEMRNILLVPVAPHLSIERAIVLPEGSEVEAEVRTESHAALSCDGHEPVAVADGDRIRVRASERSALFARAQGRGYFFRNILARLSRNPQAGVPDGEI